MATKEVIDPSASSATVVEDSLNEYRKLQQLRYKQRQEEKEAKERRAEEEAAAAALKSKLEEEDRKAAATLVATAAPSHYSADEELARKLQDEENVRAREAQDREDGIPAPSRTGYHERLLDDSPWGRGNTRNAHTRLLNSGTRTAAGGPASPEARPAGWLDSCWGTEWEEVEDEEAGQQGQSRVPMVRCCGLRMRRSALATYASMASLLLMAGVFVAIKFQPSNDQQ